MVLKYIDNNGDVYELQGGPKGDTGESAFEAWQRTVDPSGTMEDFLGSLGPDFWPSEHVETTAGPTYDVPSTFSTVVLTATDAVTVAIADAVTKHAGTNPDGLTFTLHIKGGSNITWDPAISLYGWPASPPADIWATVLRSEGAWVVLVGHAT